MKLALSSLIVSMSVLAACASKAPSSATAPASPSATPVPSATPAAPGSTPSASPTPTANGTKTSGYQFSCIRDSDTRKIEIFAISPIGCEVMYTKFGATNQIASSSKGMTHCQATGTKVRTNLEGAGYQCK